MDRLIIIINRGESAGIVTSEHSIEPPLKQGDSATFDCVLTSVGLSEGLNSANLSLSIILDEYEGVNYRGNQTEGISVQLANTSTRVSMYNE